MNIKINEQSIEIAENSFLFDIINPKEFEIIILNGHLIGKNVKLKNNDSIYALNKKNAYNKEDLEMFLSARHTPNIQKKLKNAKIAIAGLGGLGSHIAVSFARMGIGTIKLVDFDIVDPTNIHRQYYFIDQIGMFKTEALLETLKRINPFLKYETANIKINESNIVDLFKNYEYLMEALDNAKTKAMLINNALAKLKDITVIAASGVAGLDDFDNVKVKKLGSRLYVTGDFTNETKPNNGLIATRVTAIANMQAHIAIRKIIGEL